MEWYISDVLEELSASIFRVPTWHIVSKDWKFQISTHFQSRYWTKVGDSFMSQVKFPLERTLDGSQNLSKQGNKEETSYSYEK